MRRAAAPKRPPRHPRSNRAFSIVEATLAVVLVGGALVAALNVASAASRTSGAATQRRQAERLAQTLLAEALSMPAAGTDSTNGTGGARLGNFDHLLDYNGFRESPPRTIEGTQCGPTGWAWGATVAARSSETIDARVLDLKMYQITVTVELPDGTTVSAQALRGDSSAVQRVPVATTNQTTRVSITIDMTDGSTLHAAPEVVSQRRADAATATMGVR